MYDMYAIEWNKKAYKQLEKTDNKHQQKIVVEVRKLSGWPNCKNVKTLKNHHYDHRLRVGNYRIFFDVENKVKIIRIEEVKKRDERIY